MRVTLAVSILCLFVFALWLPTSESAVNGSDHINIWIVTHTHDDVGWLQTVDGYYLQEVQWILDTAIRCLLENPERRFTYVEMAYFYRWWNEQTTEVHKAVIALVKSKQLEFNLAGWCMNDEATTSFFSVINQMSEGALFLKDELGPNAYPTVGWHIDPFGHSSVTPSLWADMGFDAFGINRIDFRDKDQRKADKTLEFVWRGSRSLGKETEIFTHVMDSHYGTPDECSYDRSLIIQTDPLLPTYPLNFVAQGEAFVNMSRARNQWYLHDHILIPFGNDFDHQNADKSFDQMDKLIDYINSNLTLNATVRYGTLGSYIQAINSLNLTWPVYTGDFFPYASSLHQYWTGYFTSRPLLKGYVRSRAALLRATELLLYAASRSQKASSMDSKAAFQKLGLLRRALGVTQHHDAVSGTEKQFVYEDYYLQLYKGTVACAQLSSTLLAEILSASSDSTPTLYVNSTEVFPALTSSMEIAVVVFNSLAWERDSVISVPTNLTSLRVYDESMKLVSLQQLVPVDSYNPLSKQASHELLFTAILPAFGYRTFFLQIVREGEELPVSTFEKMSDVGEGSIYNDHLTLSFSDETRHLAGITMRRSGKRLGIDQNLIQYIATTDGGSNPYVFRPTQDNFVTIGLQHSGSYKSRAWNFYLPQKNYGNLSFPLLLAMPASDGQVSDTFAASVAHTNGNQTQFAVRRAKGSTWSQNLELSYAVLDPLQAPLSQMTGYQYGSVEVPKSEDNCKTVEIQFKTSFSSPAHVITTVDSQRFAEDAFGSTVVSSSDTGASVNICRSDFSQHGWNSDIFLNYLAYDHEMETSDQARTGTFSFTVSDAKQPRQTVVKVGGYKVFQPMVLATAMSKSGKVYAVTSYSANASQFGVNVHSLDGKTWSDEITVSWILFQRNTVEAPVVPDGNITLVYTAGSVMSEVRVVYRDYYKLAYRLYQGNSTMAQFVEQVYDIGPLDQARELVTRFQTNISNSEWYSDDTGLELIPRKFDPSRDEAVAGNYYPMVMGVYLNDTDSGMSLSVLSDRSHGAASLEDGNLEIMLHRRLVVSDLGEVLNETDHIRPRMWLVPNDDASESYNLRHKLSLELNNPPVVRYGKAPIGNWSKLYKTSFSAMEKPFPDNIHLLSLKARNSTNGTDTNFLVRFQHVFEKDEPNPLARPIAFSTDDYFAEGFKPSLFKEMTLSGNREKSSVHRMNWNTASDQDTSAEKIWQESFDGTDANTVRLIPRQIRTFLANGHN